jgi:CubicO group peptidase (beta-lactamase class C family)
MPLAEPFKLNCFSQLACAAAVLLLSSCTTGGASRDTSGPAAQVCAAPLFAFAKPEAQGVSAQKLLELTNWIVDHPTPVFSFLISKNSQVVFELLTSGLSRDEAHYLMSGTKSVTSALVGVAIDRGQISGPGASLARLLPKKEFVNESVRARFEQVSLRDVLGMSALDAELPPAHSSPEARARQRAFHFSEDRLKFALNQKLLAKPGVDFQYTDVNTVLVAGAVQFATQKSLLDEAKEALFAPMGFENEEWMHEDKAGLASGGYGLRLRPIDMQKFGMLYLNSGCWGTRRLLSKAWVDTSFTPWVRSTPASTEPDYGWYWWKERYEDGWVAHLANGFQGQRIAVFPEQKVVVTMTGAIHDGTEDRVFAGLINKFVIPAFNKGADGSPYDSNMALDLGLNRAKMQNRISPDLEPRMIPSRTAKESHSPVGK